MPYDSSLDNCLFSKSWKGPTGQITVGVFSYNNGAKKLQISRETASMDGELKFAKLGRMTKDEITGILPFIQEAMGQLD